MIKKIIFVSLLCFIATASLARPLTPQDQGFEILAITQDVVTHADGKMESHYSYRYRILSEQGIQSFNIYHVPYNTNTQTVTLNHVEVKNPEGTTIVDPKNIEEKSIFGGISGYDETKTKVIALPNIKVGSEIAIDYAYTLFHAPFKDTLSDRFELFFNADVKDFNFTLTAPAGAVVDLHDPSGSMAALYKEAATPDGGKKITISGKNLKGIGTTIEDAPLPPEHELAWLDVSNLKNFEDAGKRAGEGFDKVLAAPVPERFKTLFGPKPTAPLDETEARNRLTTILKTLTDNFRYFGDWRSVDGGFVPRALSEIDKTGYGDCKDFAVLSTVAARYLGLTAEPVLVFRSDDPFQTVKIPDLGVYNHAIARVQIPGKTDWWWVDATNRIPQVGLTPMDIAGRSALSMGPKPGRIEIPRDGVEQSTQNVSVTIDPSVAPDDRFVASVTMSGGLGWVIQRQLFSRSPKQVEEFVMSFLGISVSDAKNFKLAQMTSDPNFPYTVSFQFEVTELSGLARSGNLKILPVIVFGDAHERIMGVVPAERGSDLMMGQLTHVTVKQNIAPGSYSKTVGAPQSCDIKSPWLEYSRKVTGGTDFTITDEYKVLKYRVSLAELKSPEFAKVQTELRDCLKGIRIVVE